MKTYEEDFKLKMVQLYNAEKSVQSLCSEFELKSLSIIISLFNIKIIILSFFFI